MYKIEDAYTILDKYGIDRNEMLNNEISLADVVFLLLNGKTLKNLTEFYGNDIYCWDGDYKLHSIPNFSKELNKYFTGVKANNKLIHGTWANTMIAIIENKLEPVYKYKEHREHVTRELEHLRV